MSEKSQKPCKIPVEHTSFQFLNSLSAFLATAIVDADAVLVSTEKLKTQLTAHNRH